MHQMTDKTKTGGKAQGVGHIGTLLMIDIVFLFAHAALECASKPLHFCSKKGMNIWLTKMEVRGKYRSARS